MQKRKKRQKKGEKRLYKLQIMLYNVGTSKKEWENKMARYVFSYTIDKECVIYEESLPEEDKMDVKDGVVLTDFTGNGYLAFWTRCKNLIRDYERIARVIKNNSFRDIITPTFKFGEGQGIITDLWYGDEKMI